MKIERDGVWWRWNEREGRLEKFLTPLTMTPRNVERTECDEEKVREY